MPGEEMGSGFVGVIGGADTENHGDVLDGEREN